MVTLCFGLFATLPAPSVALTQYCSDPPLYPKYCCASLTRLIVAE